MKMNKNTLMTIGLLAGVGVGAYIVYKKFFAKSGGGAATVVSTPAAAKPRVIVKKPAPVIRRVAVRR